MITDFFQLKDVRQKDFARQAIAKIFFESATKKDFKNAEEKQQFFAKWTEYYFSSRDCDIFLSHSESRVVGYLTGCRSSQSALGYFSEKIKSYSVFADQFIDYECHFHINFSSEARGKGLGSLLIKHYVDYLASQGHRGVHIVTSPLAANVAFYEQNGFTYQLERSFMGADLLFMGRKL